MCKHAFRCAWISSSIIEVRYHSLAILALLLFLHWNFPDGFCLHLAGASQATYDISWMSCFLGGCAVPGPWAREPGKTPFVVGLGALPLRTITVLPTRYGTCIGLRGGVALHAAQYSRWNIFAIFLLYFWYSFGIFLNIFFGASGHNHPISSGNVVRHVKPPHP